MGLFNFIKKVLFPKSKKKVQTVIRRKKKATPTKPRVVLKLKTAKQHGIEIGKPYTLANCNNSRLDGIVVQVTGIERYRNELWFFIVDAEGNQMEAKLKNLVPIPEKPKVKLVILTHKQKLAKRRAKARAIRLAQIKEVTRAKRLQEKKETVLSEAKSILESEGVWVLDIQPDKNMLILEKEHAVKVGVDGAELLYKDGDGYRAFASNWGSARTVKGLLTFIKEQVGFDMTEKSFPIKNGLLVK